MNLLDDPFDLQGAHEVFKHGRPVTYDKDAYKRRNVVERSFNTLKQWRSLATRYDKLALTYRSAAVLHAVVIWSTLLGDTP